MDPDLISDTGDTLVIVSYIFTACPGCPGCFIFFCWLNQSTPWPIRPWRISPATVLGFSRRVFGGFYPSKLWWFAMFSPSKLGLTIKNWPSKFSKFPPAKSLAKSCFFSDSGHLENLGLQQEKATNEHGWAGVICHYFLLPQNGTAIYQRMTSGIELHGKSTRNGESHSFFLHQSHENPNVIPIVFRKWDYLPYFRMHHFPRQARSKAEESEEEPGIDWAWWSAMAVTIRWIRWDLPSHGVSLFQGYPGGGFLSCLVVWLPSTLFSH